MLGGLVGEQSLEANVGEREVPADRDGANRNVASDVQFEAGCCAQGQVVGLVRPQVCQAEGERRAGRLVKATDRERAAGPVEMEGERPVPLRADPGLELEPGF